MKKPTKFKIKEKTEGVSEEPPNHHVSPLISVRCPSLPSKGLCYPGEVEVSYRPMTFGEVAVIAESKMSHSKNIDYLLRGIDTNFDPYELTMSDFLYLCLLRKISTCETPKVSAKHFCTKCSKISSFVFSISDLEFEDLAAPKLPVTWKKLNFLPLTLKKYKELVKMEKEEDPIYILAASCVSLSIEEAHKLVFNSSASEAQTLQKIDEYLNHGVKDYTFVCKNKSLSEEKEFCENKVSVSLVGGEGGIKPFREDDSGDTDVIGFG